MNPRLTVKLMTSQRDPTGKHWSVCLCVALSSSSSACLWNLKWVSVGLDMADMIYCWFKSLMPWQIEGVMLRIKTCLWLSLSTVCSFCLSLGTILRSTWFLPLQPSRILHFITTMCVWIYNHSQSHVTNLWIFFFQGKVEAIQKLLLCQRSWLWHRVPGHHRENPAVILFTTLAAVTKRFVKNCSSIILEWTYNPLWG